jgi:hypothetical protein
MKLYVWHNTLSDYTSGVMFAMAHSVAEAREVIEPGWAADEAASVSNPSRYLGQVHNELRQEPTEYTTPAGFAIWGGG